MMRSVLLVSLITIGPLASNFASAQATNPSTQPNPFFVQALRSWVYRERLLTEYEQRTIKDMKLTDQQRAELDKTYQAIVYQYDKLDAMIAQDRPPTREELLSPESVAANKKVLELLGPQANNAFINKSPRHDAFQLAHVISSTTLNLGVSAEQFTQVEEILTPAFQAASKMPQVLPATEQEQIAMGAPFKQALTKAVQQLKEVLNEQQQTALFNTMPFLARLK